MSVILLWCLISFFVLGVIFQIYMIGKPRRPIAANDVIVNLIITCCWIVALLIWGH